MPKKARVKTLMRSEHVKGSETHLASAYKYFCDIFYHLERRLAQKIPF